MKSCWDTCCRSSFMLCRSKVPEGAGLDTVPDSDPGRTITKFSKENFVKILPFYFRKQHYLPARCPLIFDSFCFFTFVIHFIFGSGSKSGSGTETGMHFGSGSAMAKVPVPAVPVPQHCMKDFQAQSSALKLRTLLCLYLTASTIFPCLYGVCTHVAPPPMKYNIYFHNRD